MKKKLIVAALLTLCAGNIMAEDNVTGTIYGNPTGTAWTMNVEFSNAETTYNAFQMDITLPAGVTVESVTPVTSRLATGENVTIDGVSTTTEFIIEKNVIDETANKVRVLGYNLGNNAIQGTTGSILKFTLNSASAVSYKDMSANITDVIFVKSADLLAANLEANENNSKIIGDANEDGNRNVSDVSVLFTSILKGTTGTLDKNAIDVNNDDKVNVSDVSVLFNKVLGKQQ